MTALFCQEGADSAAQAELEKQHLSHLYAMQGEVGITRIADITGLDVVGIPVTAVIRPRARSLAVAQGKGLTKTAAKISGMMEAIELHHAEYHCPTPARFRLRDAPVHAVVNPDVLPRFAGQTLDSAATIDWIEATDLCSSRPVWVPHRAVTMDRRDNRNPAEIFIGGATGLAAGFTLAAAVNHGLCEVIERDAFALWKTALQCGWQPMDIDLDSVDDATCRGLIDRFSAAGLLVAVWDMTSDFGIPVFLVEAIDPQSPPATLINYSHGAGCDIRPSGALRKALLEAAQVRLTYISGARDDLLESDYGTQFDDIVTHRLAFLQCRRKSQAFPASPVASSRTSPSSIEEKNAFLLQRLWAHGKQTLAVDLTQERSGVHVVKVIIPGLEDDVGGTDCEPGIRAIRRRIACWLRQSPCVA